MTTSFLHLPFELQSHILTSAFLTALDLDLSAGSVRAYSSIPTSHLSTKSHLSSMDKLSPMHHCTHIYALFTQLLPLTLPAVEVGINAATDPIGMTGEAAASSSSSEQGDDDNDNEFDDDDDTLNLISPNQLIYSLCQVRKALQCDAEATKAQMREIVLRHPWARVAGEAYCSLWRRKERAVRVGEVVGAALAVVEGNGVGLEAEKEAEKGGKVVEVREVKGEEEEKGICEGFLVGEMVARCYE